MRTPIAVFTILITCISFMHIYKTLEAESKTIVSVQSLASQFASQIEYPIYDIKTEQGFNMDCVKVIIIPTNKFIGVFHSSLEQKGSNYNALYLAQKLSTFTDANWTKIVKLSEKGSQGYLYQLKNSSALLVLYELQNHSRGNTVAIRYYQSYQKLKVNNFLYEYQLIQKIDAVGVRNIGTPSIENVTFIQQETDVHKSRFNLTLKFHYSPDGVKDVPGYGSVNLYPLRDFVDSQGQWVGGCRQNYGDWKGNTDAKIQQAIARVSAYSKIGQRDLFTLLQNGKVNKYYLYEVNVNPSFNWKDWRIILYSEKDNLAVKIPFSFDGDKDVANPHISAFSHQSNGKQIFFVSFFLPSEGVRPGSSVKAGQMTALVSLTL